jgi:hypothetical protein
MNSQTLQKILVPAVGIAAVVMGYRMAGWLGIAAVTGGLFMWVMLNYTRMVKVLERAGTRPIGYLDSAVMLNAKLKPRMNLLHVVAMTRSLGERLTEPFANPELYRWTDPGGSHVTCTFLNGKLSHHELWRPEGGESVPAQDALPPGP